MVLLISILILFHLLVLPQVTLHQYLNNQQLIHYIIQQNKQKLLILEIKDKFNFLK